MNPGWVLALSLLGAPQVTVQGETRVDADAVTRGLEARLGAAAEPWTVSIEPAQGGVRVRARAQGRALVDQSVELPEDGSDEARAMIVASTVAFALEQAGTVDASEEPEPPPAVVAPVEPAPPWWVSVTGALGLGLGPLDPSGALALDGGRWFGEHVRASVSLGWAHAREQPLKVHAFQPMVQADAGAAVGERLWVGGGVGLGATGAWAFDEARASAWALRVHVPAIFEATLVGPLFLRGTAGFDVQTPVFNFRGAQRSLRWGVLRPFLGLGFGLRLG